MHVAFLFPYALAVWWIGPAWVFCYRGNPVLINQKARALFPIVTGEIKEAEPHINYLRMRDILGI